MNKQHRFLHRLNRLLWCLLIPAASVGQTFYYDPPPRRETAEVRLMLEASNRLRDSITRNGVNQGRLSIVDIGADSYLLPDGYFDVYRWTSGRWENLYRGFEHGYNFRSSKFAFDGQLYSQGGYGYWRQHGNLISFDFVTGLWEIIPLHGTEPPGQGVNLILDSFLYILQPSIEFDGAPWLNRQPGKTPRIHLTRREVEHIHFPINKLEDNSANTLVELDNYYLILDKPVYLVVKQSGKSYWLDQSHFKSLFTAKFSANTSYYSTGNSVVVFDRDLNTISGTDLDQQPLVWKAIRNDTWLPVYNWLLLGLSLLLIFGVWLFRNTRAKARRKMETGYYHPLIQALLARSGQTLTVEEIDELLQLREIIGLENLRYRRSAAINEINLEMKSRTGKQLIVRAPDPEDKRRFLYRISH